MQLHEWRIIIGNVIHSYLGWAAGSGTEASVQIGSRKSAEMKTYSYKSLRWIQLQGELVIPPHIPIGKCNIARANYKAGPLDPIHRHTWQCETQYIDSHTASSSDPF